MKHHSDVNGNRGRQAFRFVATGLFGLSLVLAWVSSTRAWDSAAGTSLTTGIISLIVWGYLEVTWRRQAKAAWHVTEEGLRHITSGSQDTISWRDIQDISWQGGGIAVRCRKRISSEVRSEQVVVLNATEKECAWLQKLWRAQLESERRSQINRSPSAFASRLRFGLSVMVAVCGAVALGFVATRLYLYWDASTWPSAEGSITASQVLEVPTKRRRSVVSEIRLTFDYVVAGDAYQSDRIELFSRSYRMETDAATSFLAQHQKGRRVTIFYDPSRPHYGVLMRKPDWLQIGCLFGIGLCLLYLGTGLAKQYWAMRK